MNVTMWNSTYVSFYSNLDSDLQVAIWWPDSYYASGGGVYPTGNDVDLYVMNPNWQTVGSSASGPQVFENVSVPGAMGLGWWTIQLFGYNIPNQATLPVYYAADSYACN